MDKKEELAKKMAKGQAEKDYQFNIKLTFDDPRKIMEFTRTHTKKKKDDNRQPDY